MSDSPEPKDPKPANAGGMKRPVPPVYGAGNPPVSGSSKGNPGVPTRGGGAGRAMSAIAGAAKAKATGGSVAQGATRGLADGGSGASVEETAIDQVKSDLKNIAAEASLNAAAGAVAGGGAGAAIGAAKGAGLAAIKSKTAKKVAAGLLVAALVVGIAVVNVVTVVLPVQEKSVTAASNIAAKDKAIKGTITDAAHYQDLTEVSATTQVPSSVLAAIQHVQSINKKDVGPFGLDLSRVGGKIDAAGAADYLKSATFVAKRLSIAVRDEVAALPDPSLDTGYLEGTDEKGNRARQLDESEAGTAGRAKSKAAWVKALKELPLTGIADNAEGIYALASTWASGQSCLTDAEAPGLVDESGEKIATLNASQSGYAKKIVAQTILQKLPRQAAVIAIMTAMQESTLRMYWNPKVPGSEALAPDKAAKGTDHYSVGLFQQQVNGTKFSWGTVAEAMDPAKSTGMFLTRLATIAGWEDLELGVAAQKVQISAVPTAYAKWEGLAETVVTASTPEGTVWGSGAGGSDGGADSTEGGECKPLGNPDVGEGIPVTGEFVWPVKAGKPGPPFGWRLHPIGKKWKIHYGVDVALPGGTPIYAASSGTVKDVRFWGTYGNWVEIQHANGISSGYAHIMNGGTLVTKGQHVDAGQMIAKVGTTGGSTGNHLHFEIIQTDQGNRRIDPEAFYQGRIVTDKDIKRPGA